ncbi:MAG: NAD(+) synthase [Bacteroidia bacterium]|nr:NAD(+) synthase [Bacteroidia bacterium]MDW8235113.1 NAD(+) synthase [Bacteroidia bacterium]
MRIGAVSLRTTPLDFEGNVQRVIHFLREAQKNKVQIVVFPELCLSGYECGDFFWHPWIEEAAWQALQKVLPETAGIIAAIGLPLQIGGKLYNAAAVVGGGRVWGFSLKRHLPRENVFYEPRWFHPAPEGRLIEERSEQPAGYALPFSWRGMTITVEICEDAWRPQRPLERHLTHIGLVLNASPFEMRKASRRRRLIQETSARYQCVYAYANLAGNEAGKLLYEGESLIAWRGEIVAATPRFFYEDGALTYVELPGEALRRNVLTSLLPAAEHPVEIVIPELAPADAAPLPASLKLTEDSPWQELTEAIAMGLWDYLWKSRSRSFVVSLSGGLDSAACAVLGALGLRKAQEQLSPETYQQRLAYMLPHQPQVYTFYQATAQSSTTTYQRARDLAQALGIPFHRWDLEDIRRMYEEKVELWLGRSLSWEQDDIARQNLQARIRVPGLWMAANLLGALLLTTSNRSELSVGYSTMDGDTAGGLAPIAGVAKADLREWGLWAAEALSLPVLAEIAQATPTAELRPVAQADEEDLMPYPILNALEFHLVFHGMRPDNLSFLVNIPDSQTPWVEKFLRLFRSSQWKRERAAPGFHVDAYDLDPRGAARFPILHALH